MEEAIHIDGVFANVRLVNLVLELHVSWTVAERLKLEHSELDFGKGTLQGPPETPFWTSLEKSTNRQGKR